MIELICIFCLGDREIISNLAKSIDAGDLNEKDGLEMSYEIALVLKSREVLL